MEFESKTKHPAQRDWPFISKGEKSAVRPQQPLARFLNKVFLFFLLVSVGLIAIRWFGQTAITADDFDALNRTEKIACLAALSEIDSKSIAVCVRGICDRDVGVGFFSYQKLIRCQNRWLVEPRKSRMLRNRELIEQLLELASNFEGEPNVSDLMDSSHARSVRKTWVLDLLRQTWNSIDGRKATGAEWMRERIATAVSDLSVDHLVAFPERNDTQQGAFDGEEVNRFFAWNGVEQLRGVSVGPIPSPVGFQSQPSLIQSMRDQIAAQPIVGASIYDGVIQDGSGMRTPSSLAVPNGEVELANATLPLRQSLDNGVSTEIDNKSLTKLEALPFGVAPNLRSVTSTRDKNTQSVDRFLGTGVVEQGAIRLADHEIDAGDTFFNGASAPSDLELASWQSRGKISESEDVAKAFGESLEGEDSATIARTSSSSIRDASKFADQLTGTDLRLQKSLNARVASFSSLANYDDCTVIQWLGSDHDGFREVAKEELAKRGLQDSEIDLVAFYVRADVEQRLGLVRFVASSPKANLKLWIPLFFRAASRDFKIQVIEILDQSNREAIDECLKLQLGEEADSIVAEKIRAQLPLRKLTP